jgi:hypothetical protein
MNYIKRRTVHLLLSSALLTASATVADNAWGQTAPAKPAEAVKANSAIEEGDKKPAAQAAANADPVASTSEPADSKPGGDASTPIGPKQEGKPGDAGMPGTGSPPPAQAILPAGPIKVDPTQIPQGPPGTPLKVQADLEIPQDPFIDSLFIVFNYVSVGAMGGALVFGVLWFLKHNKRKQMIAAGLITEDDDDDDDDDDDEPVLVKTAGSSSADADVETSAPAAVTPSPIEETKVSSDVNSVVESASIANAATGSSENPAAPSATEEKSEADDSVNGDESEANEAVTASSGAPPASSKSGKGKKNRKKKS